MSVLDDAARCSPSSEPLTAAKFWEAVDRARNHIPRQPWDDDVRAWADSERRERLRTMGLILP